MHCERNVKKMQENYFYINDKKTIFSINFNKILNRKSLEQYNDFNLSVKKSFNNIIDTILNNYNGILLNENGELYPESVYFIIHMLDAKHKLSITDSMNIDDFIKLVDKIIEAGNKNVIFLIKRYIDEHYKPMDEKELGKWKKKKEWKQLIISDEMAKNIILVSYFQCLLTPLISEYIKLNKSDTASELETENICNIVFDHIINKCVSYPNRLKNKLYKLVESRVTLMMFSGRTYWEKAAEHGINAYDVIENIYKKIITASLYKIDISMFDDDTNLVGYLQSIINNQIRFAFTLKFSENYTYYNPTSGVVSVINNDDEDMAVDIVEAALGQKDEGILVLEQLNAKEIADKIPQELGVSATREEVTELISNKILKANPVQEQLVSLMTYKYFKSTTTIKLLNAFQYGTLVLACDKYLMQHNYPILAKILVSDCYVRFDRTNVIGNKIKDKIENSKKYKELFARKYKDYEGDIESALLKLLNLIAGSNFIDKNNEEIFQDELKGPEIANEIIELAYHF